MQSQYTGDSLSTGATVVAPAANAAVASLVAPPAGEYEIRFSVSVGAGAIAADNGNVKFGLNGVTAIASVPTTGTEQIIPRITLNGAGAVSMNAIAAATAGVPYTGRITVTQLD